eukprot:384854-Pyramimonas_sp.AAC.1
MSQPFSSAERLRAMRFTACGPSRPAAFLGSSWQLCPALAPTRQVAGRAGAVSEDLLAGAGEAGLDILGGQRAVGLPR